MAELADKLSKASGRPVEYRNMSEEDYAQALKDVGLPPPVAAMLANTSKLTGEGELEDYSGDLSRLSGRPTTRLEDSIKAALK